MAYMNLRAEMARRDVKVKDIMAITGKSRTVVSRNLNGAGKFSIGDSIKIRQTFFPDVSYEILFEEVSA